MAQWSIVNLRQLCYYFGVGSNISKFPADQPVFSMYDRLYLGGSFIGSHS